jgi:hypothetical protein
VKESVILKYDTYSRIISEIGGLWDYWLSKEINAYPLKKSIEDSTFIDVSGNVYIAQLLFDTMGVKVVRWGQSPRIIDGFSK